MVLSLYFTRFLKLIIVFAAVFMLQSVARAEVMFEGYYQIKSGSSLVGYIVHAYEYDKKKKVFTSKYYIKTNKLGGNFAESLVAECDNEFKPISYQYTTDKAGAVRTIDASFKDNLMQAVVSDGKNSRTIQKKIPQGTFLSTFLGYLMLSRGVSKGKKFTYKAIAEEEAEIFAGQSFIEKSESFANIEAFRVANEFKGIKFISYFTPKGEVLSTVSPAQGISTHLVRNPVDATKGMRVSPNILKKIFGRVPTGKTNQLAKLKVTPAAEAATPDENSKSE